MDDLFAWQETYSATPGAGDPGAIRASRKMIRAMQKNNQLVAAIRGTNNGSYPRVTVEELRTYLQSEGLPNLAELTDLSLDVDGTPTRVMPDNRVLLTPADLGDLGFTAYGVTATSLELVGSNVAEMTFADAPGIVGVVEKVGPPYRQFTFVDAVAMPVLSQPSRLFVASV
ncbi:major capsid protein [Lentzea sp. JNUCC 0626]|uniref:major capsid protein n=1 Tax=Lentzea sp. JNUCC 0626 TaxID=3367513 RepID=UPI003748A515